jgi:ATP-binding cassette subfamily C protein CydD
MEIKQESASRWLMRSITEAKSQYLFASTMTVLSALCFVAFSWYLSDFAALWLTEGTILTTKLFFAMAFLSGRYVFAYFASLLNYNAGKIIVSNMKKKLYPHLLNYNQSNSVESTLLVTRSCDDLKPFFSFFVPYAVASVIVGILLLIVIFWFEKWVGITLLVIFLVIPMQMIVIGIGAEAIHNRHIKLFMNYSAVFYNRLHTIAEIVNLDNFKPQYRFLSEKSTALNTATTNVMRIAILSSAVLELFITIAIAAVSIFLGMSLLGIMPGPFYGKGYNFQIALFLLMLTPYFFFYLRKFVSAYHDRNKAVAAANLIMPILKNSVETLPIDKDEQINSFEINQLSFSYPGSMVKVLNNIKLNLPTKGIVLIKGISGSGKSTLLKICSGNLTAEAEMISINGKEKSWSQEWLRLNSSYMNQFPFIFDETLHYNVFLGKKQDKDYPEFLEKILTKKPDGWQTTLSHNGKQLSGGEKQLVTLARMLLYPKPIAILDEPTANLDADIIEIILAEVKKLAANKLVIVASHEDKFDAIASIIVQLNWGEQMHYQTSTTKA